jgi:hypothetical protein
MWQEFSSPAVENAKNQDAIGANDFTFWLFVAQRPQGQVGSSPTRPAKIFHRPLDNIPIG